jgi:hypothetical protein
METAGGTPKDFDAAIKTDIARAQEALKRP